MILCLAVASCIQDEALNVEAAIDGCSGSNIQLANINTYSKTVSIYVSKSTDLSALEIKFELPDGASINPVNALANDDAPKYDFQLRKFPLHLNKHWNNINVCSKLHLKVLPQKRSTPSLLSNQSFLLNTILRT